MIHSLSRSSGSKTHFLSLILGISWHLKSLKIFASRGIPLTKTGPKTIAPAAVAPWPQCRAVPDLWRWWWNPPSEAAAPPDFRKDPMVGPKTKERGIHGDTITRKHQKTGLNNQKSPGSSWFIHFLRWSPEWIGQNSMILQCLGEILWNPVTTSGLPGSPRLGMREHLALNTRITGFQTPEAFFRWLSQDLFQDTPNLGEPRWWKSLRKTCGVVFKTLTWGVTRARLQGTLEIGREEIEGTVATSSGWISFLTAPASLSTRARDLTKCLTRQRQQYLLVLSREWMGLGEWVITSSDYGSFPHSLRKTHQ